MLYSHIMVKTNLLLLQDNEGAVFDPNKITKKENVKKCEVILNDSRVPLPGDGNMIAKLQQEMELLKFKLNEIKKANK